MAEREMTYPQITQIKKSHKKAQKKKYWTGRGFMDLPISFCAFCGFSRLNFYLRNLWILYFASLDAITFAAVAPPPTAPAIVGASGFATSPIAKTFTTLVSCCEPTIT